MIESLSSSVIKHWILTRQSYNEEQNDKNDGGSDEVDNDDDDNQI